MEGNMGLKFPKMMVCNFQLGKPGYGKDLCMENVYQTKRLKVSLA